MAPAILALVATFAVAGPARAQSVDDAEAAVRRAQDLVDQARDLARTAEDVRDLLYYLSDPRGFQHDLYATQDQVLADPILGPLARNLASLYRGRVWTFTAQAQAVADTATPASAAVGASLAWDLPLCRLFSAQGSGQVFYEDDQPEAALSWGVGGCLPLPFDTFELGYRGRRQVRTSLLATPIALGERQSGDTVYSSLRFYRWLSRDHQIDAMPFSVNFDFADGGDSGFQAYLTFSPAHWARRGKGWGGRDQTYDFVRLVYSSLGVYDDTFDSAVVTVSPLAIDGVGIGPHLALGLDVGWMYAELFDRDVLARRPSGVYLDAAVVGGTRAVSAELHVKNVMQPTIEDQVLDEDRLTARIDVSRAAAWLRADAFASHARLFGVERTSAKVWTYGAGADLTLALGKHVFGYLRAEAARAIVVDATAATPATALDARGTLGVTTQLQRQW